MTNKCPKCGNTNIDTVMLIEEVNYYTARYLLQCNDCMKCFEEY